MAALKDLKTISIGFLSLYLAYLVVHNSQLAVVVDRWSVDKLFHLAGGYFIGALAAHFLNIRSWLAFLLISFLVGLSWEAAEEFLLSPWVGLCVSFARPIFISWGDIAADVAGTFFYRKMFGSFENNKIQVFLVKTKSLS
ncbi:MAG: hypothetical protein HZB99_04005 [Candidatus Harrisonbacteria bacterium]|nr:hypothetical protein [Candidatus Harrisonbacteria bacterium]